MKYRKKPVEIENPIEFNEKRVRQTGVYPAGVDYEDDSDRFYVVTAHGQRAYLADGDRIIPEPDGEHYYPIKPDIFAETYEEVTA